MKSLAKTVLTLLIFDLVFDGGILAVLGLIMLGAIAVTQTVETHSYSKNEAESQSLTKLWATISITLVFVLIQLVLTASLAFMISSKKREKRSSLTLTKIWLLVSLIFSAIISLNYFEPIPLYEQVYYGIVLGFRLLTWILVWRMFVLERRVIRNRSSGNGNNDGRTEKNGYALGTTDPEETIC